MESVSFQDWGLGEKTRGYYMIIKGQIVYNFDFKLDLTAGGLCNGAFSSKSLVPNPEI